MNVLKNNHHRFENPNGEELHYGHPPYWKRAHRDWRIWFCVILMLGAMLVYLMSGDLRWQIHGQSQQPVSGTVGK
jgi:hypothetical protein